MPKLNKKILSLLVAVSSLVACSSNNVTNNIAAGEDINLLDNVEFDYDNAFFDDFSNGVSSDNWYIGKQAWGGSNGGVVPNNIKYTDDGTLVITGNGKYYLDGDIKGVGDVKDGRYTGGALISKFMVQPGRYEIKMKVLPRVGACTAFWTFAYDVDDASNHEIDIELPGGHRSDNISFSNVLNTNYIKENLNQSQDIKVKETFSSPDEIYFNDGKWHTFGFDWYTDPECVVYYVDGKISAISNVFVPNKQARLWVGCWFPVTSAFVGSADFETDNMYVDYVKYIPFKNQPYEEFTPPISGYAFDAEYPTSPISTPTINKISNGTFEKLKYNTSQIGGWRLTKRVSEEKDISEIVKIVDDQGYEDSKALSVSDGAIVYQLIDSVYHGFKHDFSFYAKGNGKVTIRYYGVTTSEILLSKTIEVNSDELQKYHLDLEAPKNSQTIRINLESSTGNSLIVDNFELYLKGDTYGK